MEFIYIYICLFSVAIQVSLQKNLINCLGVEPGGEVGVFSFTVETFT